MSAYLVFLVVMLYRCTHVLDNVKILENVLDMLKCYTESKMVLTSKMFSFSFSTIDIIIN